MIQRDRQEQTLKADILKEIRMYETVWIITKILYKLDYLQKKIQYVRFICFPLSFFND